MSATGQAVHSIHAAALPLPPVLLTQGVLHCPGAGFEGQNVRPTWEGQGWEKTPSRLDFSYTRPEHVLANDRFRKGAEKTGRGSHLAWLLAGACVGCPSAWFDLEVIRYNRQPPTPTHANTSFSVPFQWFS